jgi:uncharacterized membrane protein
MNYEEIVIISAELPTLDFYANTERTSQLRADLLSAGYNFVCARINTLQGFIVITTDEESLKKLAQKYDIKNIYISDKTRQTNKIGCLEEKNAVHLGKLLKISKSVKMEERELRISFTEDGTEYLFVTEI